MASLAALAGHSPAMADDSVEERLAKMEQRIQYLEQRVATQDEVIVEKDRAIAALSEQGAAADGWSNAITLGGAIELETVYGRPYEGGSTTEAGVGTAELVIRAEIDDWVGGEVVVKNRDDAIELDAATLTIAQPEGPWFLTGGQQGLPFGVYETNMISDPLTKEIGDTGQVSLVAGFSPGDVHASFFVFDGINIPDDNARITGHGGTIGYALGREGIEVSLDASYISNINDSDDVSEAIPEWAAGKGIPGLFRPDRVPGWSASAQIRSGPVSLIGEYLAAGRELGKGQYLAPDGEWMNAELTEADIWKPSAWTLEAGYDFTLVDRDATIAVGYQATDDAFALGLPKTRMLAALSVGLFEQVGLAFEWARDDDYSMNEGGTGGRADTATVLLAAEF